MCLRIVSAAAAEQSAEPRPECRVITTPRHCDEMCDEMCDAASRGVAGMRRARGAGPGGTREM